MPDIAFLCSCKCLFGAYLSDGEEKRAACPLCGQVTERWIDDSAGPHTTPILRLPNDQYDYRSPIDGSIISSKRAHRDHLKRHNVIELGNEKPDLTKPLTPTIPKEELRSEMKNQLERMKSDGSWRER